jgi:hypothetical protein
MPEEEADELLAWLDELLAVNSDPDVDLDGDDDEVAEDWDEMAGWDLDGDEEEDGEDLSCAAGAEQE